MQRQKWLQYNDKCPETKKQYIFTIRIVSKSQERPKTNLIYFIPMRHISLISWNKEQKFFKGAVNSVTERLSNTAPREESRMSLAFFFCLDIQYWAVFYY